MGRIQILKNFPLKINFLGSRLSECYLAIGEIEKGLHAKF